MNLLKETEEFLTNHDKSGEDVRYVICLEPDFLKDIGTPKVDALGSWDDFVAFADFDYNPSYGGAEVNTDLKIVGDDWWIERGEYDGSEWWEFKTLPQKPVNAVALEAKDLKERW